MKTIKYISLFIATLFTVCVNAQTLSVADQRYMNMDVLNLLLDYEYYSPLSDNSLKKGFRGLFENSSISIYNDLLGLSAAEKLTVDEYIELMGSQSLAQSVVIKNLQHGSAYKDGDKWVMKITFEKEIEYINQCEVLFSSKEFYQADHQLIALISWEPKSRMCKIRELSGKIESETPPLPEEYIIFTQSSAFDANLLYKDKEIEYNNFGQAFLDKDLSLYTYPRDTDMKFELVMESEDCNVAYMAYTPMYWRIKPHVDVVLGSSYNLMPVNDDLEMVNSTSSWSAGMDFGYILPSAKKAKWGLFSGVALRKTTLRATINELEYSYQAGKEADIDGDIYMRNYKIKDMQYRRTMTELSVPLYLDYDYRFNQRVSAYVDLGAKANFCIGNPTTSFSAIYTTSGTYSQYGNITFDAESFPDFELNGFVKEKHISYDDIGTSSKQKTVGWELDVFGGVGIRARVYDDWYVDLGCSYQTTLTEPHQGGGSVKVGNSNKGILNAFEVPMTYTVKGGESVKDVTGYFASMKRKVWQLNMGIMYRF